jgi:hypothetical protein
MRLKEELLLSDMDSSLSDKIVFRCTKAASRDDDRGSKYRFLDSFCYSLEIIPTAAVRTSPIPFSARHLAMQEEFVSTI